MMRHTPQIVFLSTALLLGLSACGSQDQHDDPSPEEVGVDPEDGEGESVDMVDMVEAREQLRQKLEDANIEPLEPLEPRDPAKVELGQALFFDAETSGSRDVACGTCHRPAQASVDGLELPVGTSARVDPETGARTPGPELAFVSRNVPDLFNRGHMTSMFWDRRMTTIEVDGEERFALHDFSEAYAPDNYLRVMPRELDNILSAQNMLPVLNRDELRGANGSVDIFGEVNELAQVPNVDFESAWAAVMRRLLALEGYRELFAAAYPDVPLEELTFAHAAMGISAFIIDSFTLLDSPWDRYLAGEEDALTDEQVRGALLFYGKGQCSLCHTGSLLTDQTFHNIGVPPIGRGPDTTEFLDRGVAHRSLAGNANAFAFRTPPLRNVELTGPYTHNGAYNTLEAVIRHKNDVTAALWSYDISQLRLEFQSLVHRRRASYEAVERTLSPFFSTPLDLTEAEIDELVAFLKALTSPQAHDMTHIIPESVPSGLLIEIPEPVPRPNLEN